jgi:hypothetical protein
MKLMFSQGLFEPHNIKLKLQLKKKNKFTQQKETIWAVYALPPLAYIAKKHYNGNILICNKLFYSIILLLITMVTR